MPNMPWANQPRITSRWPTAAVSITDHGLLYDATMQWNKERLRAGSEKAAFLSAWRAMAGNLAMLAAGDHLPPARRVLP
ncbi:hypothetical protein DES47_104367 [Roseateles toxinivorans]|uniref:Uncharacterized protein n=2 Tax=Roseateles toxinivorans TaxID=270368 RepID=A0A4R6QLN5_9BURK|nr:hypothetical protein DES47_104367 [Roseateles toxinivorans]